MRLTCEEYHLDLPQSHVLLTWKLCLWSCSSQRIQYCNYRITFCLSLDMTWWAVVCGINQFIKKQSIFDGQLSHSMFRSTTANHYGGRTKIGTHSSAVLWEHYVQIQRIVSAQRVKFIIKNCFKSLFILYMW